VKSACGSVLLVLSCVRIKDNELLTCAPLALSVTQNILSLNTILKVVCSTEQEVRRITKFRSSKSGAPRGTSHCDDTRRPTPPRSRDLVFEVDLNHPLPPAGPGGWVRFFRLCGHSHCSSLAAGRARSRLAMGGASMRGWPPCRACRCDVMVGRSAVRDSPDFLF